MKPKELLECIHTLEDDRFDLAYPPKIRAASSDHWTPVPIARRAAEFLVQEPGTRVLDIGCGPGKFCIVGALTTEGRFTGVEQRQHLCNVARSIIKQVQIPNATILHCNVMEIEFCNFDAFYVFNPFEENLEPTIKIDRTVKFSGDLYVKYTEHVARQFALAPLGTRIVTYYGMCEEVPMGYECIAAGLPYGLKFWEKKRCYPVRMNSMGTKPTTNQWRLWPHLSQADKSVD